MGKNSNPPNWVDVYANDEEQLLFIALARNPKYEWRSVAHLSKEVGVSKERIEKMLNKYYKKGMVFQSSKNDSLWAYWERVPDLVKKDNDVCNQDKKARIQTILDQGN